MISGIAKVTDREKQSVYNAFTGTPNLVIFDRQNLTTRFVMTVKHDFELLITLSMVFVTLLLLITLGRIELTIITSLPMYFSWLITLGFMGFTGIRFNIFNIIISSFIFGLGVDYSILMMRGLLSQYRSGVNDMKTYQVSILLSSATTLIGVGVLFFARHPALNSIALISIIGIISVVIISLSYQSMITRWLLLTPMRKRSYPLTAQIIMHSIFLPWIPLAVDNTMKIRLNYLYKGPVLEWYIRVKMALENNFDSYYSLLPRKGEILDLGCGYGYISYMLMLTSEERIITGVDYDEKKIMIAQHGYLRNERISFVKEDITKYKITPKDGFLFGDVLHYLPFDKQEALLKDCIMNLNPGGVILIREGNSDKESRHKRTKFTEFFSTKVLRFNKTQDNTGKLYFTSATILFTFAEEHGLTFEIVDQKRITSNNFFIMRMPLKDNSISSLT